MTTTTTQEEEAMKKPQMMFRDEPKLQAVYEAALLKGLPSNEAFDEAVFYSLKDYHRGYDLGRAEAFEGKVPSLQSETDQRFLMGYRDGHNDAGSEWRYAAALRSQG